MPSPLFAKLIEITYKAVQADLKDHEIEDRLVDSLLGKSLNFTTEGDSKGTVSFHSIGKGSKNPSSIITLQVEGIEFEQKSTRVTEDLRYIYYNTHGYTFFFGSPTEFLVTSPFVRKLGPSNILIEFVIYGNTIHQVNRCLTIFAEVIKKYQGELHQTAIEQYENGEIELDDDSSVSLEEPLSEEISQDNPMEFVRTRVDDEVYIKEYAKYLDDDGFRDMLNNRNTFAESKLE